MIDLDEIIENHPKRHCNCHECIKEVITDTVRQALELACERAKATEKFNTDLNKWVVGVNKESIMSIMEDLS